MKTSPRQHSTPPLNRYLIAAAIFLASPYLLHGQGLGQEALACFPPDTQQVAYANLDQLRDLPNYSQLRLALFNSRMNGFERLLKSVGSDPETDVDAVILGWRGSAMNASSFFGLAEGNFDPTAAQTAVVQQHLSTRQYAGFVLSGDHSGASGGMFFTYLSSTLVAFGRLSDVEALVDGYLGNRSALNSNSNFVNWEGELDGQAPQWGITTGAAAAKVAAPWLGAGKQSMSDLTALFKPIKAVLYQVDWSNSFTVHLSVVCDSAGDAQTLDRLLGIWQNSMAANNGASAGVNQFMQNVEISADGSRVELDGSGSPSLLGQLFRNGQPR